MSLIKRWLFAQHVEAEAWKDFGTVSRHFSREYWDWELGFLGLNVDYLEDLASCNLLEVGCGPFRDSLSSGHKAFPKARIPELLHHRGIRAVIGSALWNVCEKERILSQHEASFSKN